MLKRTITGIVMAGFLLLVIYLTSFSHFVFDGLVLIVGGIAAWEIYVAVKKGGFVKSDGTSTEELATPKTYDISLVSMIISFATVYPFCYFFGYTGLFFCFVISLLVAFVIFIFDQNKSFNDFAANCFALIYPITLLGVIFVMNNEYGMIPVLLAVGISTVSDAAAYFIGSALGKKKIFPKISPKKTYAGFFGGIFGGALGGIIVYLIFELGSFPTHIIFTFTGLFNGKKWAAILLYALVGAIMAVFSEIGDLAASRVKRQLGIKDYGKILGSHGGIMDRIDSILFTASAMAIIMEIISLCTR